MRRQRARGLLELGRIFRAARAPYSATSGSGGGGGGGASPRAAAAAGKPQQRQQKTAKQHMEDAMMHVMEMRMQAEEKEGR